MGQPRCVKHGGHTGSYWFLIGSFRAGGGNGTVLKKCSKSEASVLKALMSDCMKPYVPEFRKELETEGDCMFFLVLGYCRCYFSSTFLQGILKCKTC